MKTRPTLPRGAVLAAFAAAALLAAGCNRNEAPADDRTVGQRVDDAAQSAAQTSGTAADRAGAAMDRTGERVENAAERAGNQIEKAADSAGDKVADAAITTSVNAELAKDPALSALQINVDTTNGRVLLRGKAPNAAAKERATMLARNVKGVVAVENQLDVRS